MSSEGQDADFDFGEAEEEMFRFGQLLTAAETGGTWPGAVAASRRVEPIRPWDEAQTAQRG